MREGRPELTGKFGKDSRRWLGDKAGYVAKHSWLTKHYDKGDSCEECGTIEAKRLEWANISGEYKRDRSDYRVLCVPCHRRQDLDSTECKNGHLRTSVNTNYRNGWKVCKDCVREANRRYYAKNN